MDEAVVLALFVSFVPKEEKQLKFNHSMSSQQKSRAIFTQSIMKLFSSSFLLWYGYVHRHHSGRLTYLCYSMTLPMKYIHN
jgi:lysylphosphatidylglycerol synthetase-like protein (DUF2156 family)